MRHAVAGRRRLGVMLAGMAVAAVLALTPAWAAGATVGVTMDDGYAFSPTVRSIARGDRVRWSNEGSTPHDVASRLAGYFASPGGIGGLTGGEAYARTFVSAGTFRYVCRLHEAEGMTGRVVVPIAVRVLTGPTRFRVVVASEAIDGRWRHVVQVRAPGSSSWRTLVTTTAASVTYRPQRRGMYEFRSAVRDTRTGSISGFSPVVVRTY